MFWLELNCILKNNFFKGYNITISVVHIEKSHFRRQFWKKRWEFFFACHTIIIFGFLLDKMHQSRNWKKKYCLVTFYSEIFDKNFCHGAFCISETSEKIKNPQFNFLIQNLWLDLRKYFFQISRMEKQQLLFHTIWKIITKNYLDFHIPKNGTFWIIFSGDFQ